ncbi:MAG: intradiol ring-cleavage dioxygenase [Chloroflexota bacterium]|nr:intradiol ring-cleavage dioxygenase [Chloroflexota bacterium]
MVFQAELNRRRMLAGLAGATIAPLAVGGAVSAQDETSTPASDAANLSSCLLFPETTEGPYYLDDMLVRQDIADGKAGVPLDLTMTVVDAETCAPIANAAVEIWHCDAKGFYSGFVDNSPGGQANDSGYIDDGSDAGAFLRGIQVSDTNGNVTFNTIYPGWYGGRAIHIHLSVHLGGETEDGTYEGGTTAHTGQIGFDDAITELVAEIEPYASRTSTFLLTSEDGIFSPHLDDESVFVTLEQVNPEAVEDGFTGTILLGIDQA